MAVDEKYNMICDKLGFKPDEYAPKLSDMEDDSKPNPFSVLTLDEEMYLFENGYLGAKAI